jgi:hypothetical protein
MRWLRLGGVKGNLQSIDSNCHVQQGDTLDMTVRTKKSIGDGWICGCRTAWNGIDKFGVYIKYGCFWFGYGAVEEAMDYDMGWNAGNDIKIYNIHLEPSHGSVNGRRLDLNGTIINPTRSFFVGSINTGGDIEPFYPGVDIGEIVIKNSAGVEKLHLVPVKQGSTEYSVIPAPSDCLFDLVSKTYKVKYAGPGMPHYEDDSEDENSSVGGTSVIPTRNYGLKVVANDDSNLVYMNSAYKLIGADIACSAPQIKSYTIDIVGDAPEPPVNPPPHIFDNVYRSGEGFHRRRIGTIDTGYSDRNLRIMSLGWGQIQPSVVKGRAHEYWWSTQNDMFNVFLPPNSTSCQLTYTNWSRLLYRYTNGEDGASVTFFVSHVNGEFPAVGNINGTQKTLPSTLIGLALASIEFVVEPGGKIGVFSRVPYGWMQRAYDDWHGFRFESRAWVWMWLSGFSLTLSVLRTPYDLDKL